MSNFKKKEKTKNRENSTWDYTFVIIIIIFLILISIILCFPVWFTSGSFLDFDFTETGQIGDTIGGIAGPFVAIVAAALTFLAFWVQYKANEQQKIDLKIERFESKFYEMLRLHRANVEEMSIDSNLKGRNVFMPMYYELAACYRYCNHLIVPSVSPFPEEYRNRKGYDKITTIEIAYIIFFHGIGKDQERLYTYSLKAGEKDLLGMVRKNLKSIQDEYKTHKKKNSPLSDDCPYTKSEDLPDCNGKGNFKIDISLYSLPFNGHSNQLAHYYRHLYHTVKYVTQQDYLTQTEKESYIRTFRAQLSNFEQLLLYYNGIAFFEDHWEDLFIEYRLIKNIPLILANLGENPEVKYASKIKEQAELNKKVFELQKTKTKWEREHSQTN